MHGQNHIKNNYPYFVSVSTGKFYDYLKLGHTRFHNCAFFLIFTNYPIAGIVATDMAIKTNSGKL